MQSKWQWTGWLGWTVWTVWMACYLTGLADSARPSGSLAVAETRTVTADESLRAGGVHRWLTGSGYRDLWTVPIDVEVLDMHREAGGLRPAFRVGGLQTLGLAISGADGRSYTFRGLVKDLSTSLPPDFRGTLAAKAVQDQLAAAHPAGALIVPPLAEAAGILHNEPRLVVMPDDAALGEFREAFAGRLGTFEEFPTPASDKHPGFHGATEILSTRKLWPLLVASPAERIDARAFLRARLLDVLVGDWDRHANQWRWARIPGMTQWQPIPEDRDWAFADYEGFVISLLRPFQPTLITFSEQYPSMTGLTLNGWQLIRWLLPELDKPAWDEVAGAMRQQITDEVIDAAVRRMPLPYQKINGVALAETLKQRRDSLPEIADRFYRFLASQVDVQGTDKSEHVEIRKLDDESLEVSVALQSDMGTGLAPYFRRRFLATETQEIRIYLRQGADTVTCGGLASSPITVYVIGNQANDVMAQCNVAGIHFTDAEQLQRNLHPIPIEPDPRRQFPPVPTLPESWDKPRDWGAMPVPIPWFSIGSDYGLFLGGGLSYERFGFGKVPYAQRHLLRGGYAFGINEFKIDYEGSFRYLNPDLMSTLGASISGIEVIRFYGFGNNTSSDGSDSFFKTEQLQLIFTPALQYSLTPQLEVFTGLQLKYAHTDDDKDTLLNQLQPYGVGKFGQIRFHAGFDFDTRDRSHVYGPGAHLHLQGMYYPEVWDVQSHFGAIEGTVAGYVSLSKRLLLTMRLGGKHVFGTFPFHEAAYVGGSKTVRGYRSDRFAGDSSLFANTELRVDLGKAAIVLPAEWGVFIFGDVGRVFLDGESSKTWHPAGGGGVYASILDRSLLLTLSVARSEELTVFFLKTEFTF